MAKMTLRAWINAQQKAKGLSTTAAKKDAGKYKSISAAKKAGSLYYTDKNGKYTIEVNQGEILIFSFLGKIDKEVLVSNSKKINVVLNQEELLIGQVIVE